jgi:hypothetical protein
VLVLCAWARGALVVRGPALRPSLAHSSTAQHALPLSSPLLLPRSPAVAASAGATWLRRARVAPARMRVAASRSFNPAHDPNASNAYFFTLVHEQYGLPHFCRPDESSALPGWLADANLTLRARIVDYWAPAAAKWQLRDYLERLGFVVKTHTDREQLELSCGIVGVAAVRRASLRTRGRPRPRPTRAQRRAAHARAQGRAHARAQNRARCRAHARAPRPCSPGSTAAACSARARSQALIMKGEPDSRERRAEDWWTAEVEDAARAHHVAHANRAQALWMADPARRFPDALLAERPTAAQLLWTDELLSLAELRWWEEGPMPPRQEGVESWLTVGVLDAALWFLARDLDDAAREEAATFHRPMKCILVNTDTTEAGGKHWFTLAYDISRGVDLDLTGYDG